MVVGLGLEFCFVCFIEVLGGNGDVSGRGRWMG